MTLRLQSLRGAQIEPYLDELARLRIEVFREYPYLYDGTKEYEAKYLATYMQSPQSLFVLAFSDQQIVGASTGVPMRDESAEFQAPFRAAGYDPARIFYFGESVISRAYRGQGTGADFFRLREQYARELGGMDWCVFCAVDRAEDHPLRPAHYQPLDRFWERQGYRKLPDLKTRISWKEIDQPQETSKTLTAWMKRIIP